MSKKNQIINSPQVLDVQAAANYLGVHAGTIRRWAAAKQLVGRKVGTRGDWRFTEDELAKMATTNQAEILDSSGLILTSYSSWGNISETSHFVQFYEDDEFLINQVRNFLSQGDSAIVVATLDHIKRLEDGLKVYGLELDAARKSGQYISLDASVALSKFIVEGMPDPKLFFELFGGVLSRAHKKSRIRVFGEMVALLWVEGNQEAAIYLEELWNELQKIHNFSLACAYPITDFNQDSHTTQFTKINTLHSHVFPAESYSELDSSDEKLRKITLLQQKAQSLEAEIAKRMKMESQLRETVDSLKASEEFNRSIVENSADCIKVLDRDGRLLSMNGPGCRTMEIDDFSKIQGKKWLSFWKDENYDLASAALETAKKGGVGRFQAYSVTAKGIQKWWDIVATVVFNSAGNVDRMVVVTRDITILKELEQQKDDFLSATSHELKTPLTSQKVFVQLLQQKVEKRGDKEYKKFTTKIADQTDKLTKLVQDLLDGTKIQGGKLSLSQKAFNIKKCVMKVIESVKPTTTHDIKLIGNADKIVMGDEERIDQVLTNLIENAIKYSPKGGKVIVKVKEKNNEVIVSVKDFGIGISKSHQEHIFDRFYRASGTDERTYPGLGMGLYISSGIVKGHGGKLIVDSAIGKGSTFSFSLPLKLSN